MLTQHGRRNASSFACLALLGLLCSAIGQDFELVLAGGRIIDPESKLDAVRHIGIRAGVIRAVSETPLRGRTTVDASGLVIAPGFIDLHQHGQQLEDYQFKAQDGVTAVFELEVGTADVDAWYAARAGKAILCTKPLGRTAAEAKRMLETVEKAGVFAGYLEDLCYTPKTLKSIESVRAGAVGDVLWVRSREAHPGPHSAWFWDEKQAGGGCIVDLGCHCIEIIRNFVGKGNRPVEVLCWKDTLVHPISAEDNAIALIRFESGAMGQFEVSWTFRGGMDLRDEVAGTRGTIWLNHFLRTGFEMFTASAADGYIAEKAETTSGWLFPVGDEAAELGYVDMFTDMFNAMEAGRAPREAFYDGYVVNAVMDACYRSVEAHAWMPIELEWRGGSTPRITRTPEMFEGSAVIKRETLPDGRVKLILKDPTTGVCSDRVI